MTRKLMELFTVVVMHYLLSVGQKGQNFLSLHSYFMASKSKVLMIEALPISHNTVRFPPFLARRTNVRRGIVVPPASASASASGKAFFDYNLTTVRDRALILHMCIPCDKTFLMVP